MARGVLSVIACLLVLAGCASGPRAFGQPELAPTRGERVALLPFDNLTDTPDASRRYTQLLFDRISGEHLLELAPLAEVETVLGKYRVRRTDLLDSATVRSIGEDLRVRYLLMGTVLELAEPTISPSGQAELTVSVRVHRSMDNRIAWTCLDSRSGNDREGPFGWGLTRSANKLAQKSAESVVEKINKMVQNQKSH